MARRTYRSDHPGPVFDPAIPAAHQRALRASRHRLRAPDGPPPRKITRWRQQPIDTAGTLLGLLILAGLCWIIVVGIIDGALGDIAGSLGALALLPVAAGLPIWYVTNRAKERLDDKALRIHHGNYLRPEEFDTESAALLGRAQRAVNTVLESAVNRAGLIDNSANTVHLPQHLWDLAQIMHSQTQLRAEQRAAADGVMTDELRAVLRPQAEALRRSTATVTDRIERLEEYAHRVQVAEAAYRARTLLDSNDKYRELLARTHDEEAIAHLTTQVDQAESTLRSSLQAAIQAGETLALG